MSSKAAVKDESLLVREKALLSLGKMISMALRKKIAGSETPAPLGSQVLQVYMEGRMTANSCCRAYHSYICMIGIHMHVHIGLHMLVI